MVGGQRVYLSPRDRSFHLVIIGAIGTGKTVTMESLLRQDIDADRGVCLIDPMGALFDRLLRYCCYRKAIGCRVPELIPFNASDGSNWILPLNLFARSEGEISVQVDRRVSATLRVWGQHSGDETPRLEKWLKVIFSTLIECGLTLSDAGMIIDQRATEVRNFLLAGLEDGFIRRKLEQLSHFKPSEFSEQTESVENRLSRFLCSGHLTKIFGTGRNALDFRSIMDQGKILLVNLQPSRFLSDEQARLIGTLILNEFYETALNRPSGARAFYCYVDEAAKFVTPELAQASEQCRQKGLHLTLAFQHLAQFKEEGLRVYKAFKHIRNKLIFAVPEREDALELADDLFVGLAEPQVKFMHRHLSHLIEDVRETSTTRSEGGSQTWSKNQGVSQSTTQTQSRGIGVSHARNRSLEMGSSQGRTFTRGKSLESGTSKSRTHTEHEAHSSGYSETTSNQRNSGYNLSESQHEKREEGLFSNYEDEGRSTSKGESHSESSGYSRTETGSDSYDRGDSRSESTSRSSGASTSVAWSRGRQRAQTKGKSRTWSRQVNSSEAESQSTSSGESFSRGENHSRSITDQPGTRHTAFWEEDPEHWRLEEQRWRASELLMAQRIGHWFLRSSSNFGFGGTILPKPFYIMPSQLQRLTCQLYQRHNLEPAEAERLLGDRQKNGAGKSTIEAPPEATSMQQQTGQVWNRQGSASKASNGPRPGQRGPAKNLARHTQLQTIVRAHGESWRSAASLALICKDLDDRGIEVSDKWPELSPNPASTWQAALVFHRDRVVKALEYSLSVKLDRGE